MHIRRHLSNSSLTDLELSDQVAAVGESPCHILEKIVCHKEQEVAQMREQLSLAALQELLNDAPRPLDFLMALWQSPTRPSLIAEVKKASSSHSLTFREVSG